MQFDPNDLKESNQFLNILLDSVSSAVVIVDRDYRIRQFNGSLGKLFGREPDEMQGRRCGEALGCAFAVFENAPCGDTSQCDKCLLRNSILAAFRKKGSVRRKKFSRQFVSGGVPVQKHLAYSIRQIRFNGQELALVIIEDITEQEVRRLELVRKQKQLDLDLKAAAGIQSSLLPAAAPDLDGLLASWKFIPCSRIGGDIFNLFPLGGGRTGCFMMDASGHGVHSALVAVSVSQLLQPACSRLPLASPSEVCKELDRRFPLNRFNSFFSMLYMVLDPGKRILSWCNAGHPPAVLVRPNGEKEVLRAGGPIIGLGGLLPFHDARKEIGAGDRIYLYTDGLIERRNRNGEFLGIEGLFGAIDKVRGQSLSTSISLLLGFVMDFGQGAAPADDISLLGLEVL